MKVGDLIILLVPRAVRPRVVGRLDPLLVYTPRCLRSARRSPAARSPATVALLGVALLTVALLTVALLTVAPLPVAPLAIGTILSDTPALRNLSVPYP